MMNNQQQQRVGVGLKSMVYHGETCLGEAEVFPVSNKNNSNTNRPSLSFRFPNNEIRISYLSPPSERCLPHSVLQTISPFSVRCKIQAKSSTDPSSPLHLLYLSCFQDLKTAVVVLGSEELHLVALPSKLDKCPCFWCFAVPVGLYSPCLGLLNLRCLAIVFDLDETLIVANTMKSFEDRIEALSNRIDAENDPLRVSGMSAELKRYLEDKALLKQYVETDTVSDVVNGRLFTVQNEEVPPPATGYTPIVRPVIRLQEKNIVLTRINPEIRDTSVLVRLRPAWEDLRSYLTAKGRKRFEVYVCTMAEKDYALEIWRLLDPEFHLISSNQLLDRIVCVKAGSKKSLGNVFQAGTCHPKMSMVMDDRQKVWDEKDQQRVHVVPPFQPYCAPQAETTNAVPVLCVARNVACNVRGAFFKEFDDNLLRRSYNLHYEDEILDLPAPPDTSDYLVNEDTCIASNFNGNKDSSNIEGITAAETEKISINSIPNCLPDHVPVYILEEDQTQDQMDNSSLPDDEINMNQVPDNHKILSTAYGSKKLSLSIDALHEIGRLSDSKVEFRFITGSSNHLQFSVEVAFSSEKIGIGIGRTKNEAQTQAADNALLFLKNHYIEFMAQNDGLTMCDSDKLYSRKENGFLEEEEDEDGDHVLDAFTQKHDLAGSTVAAVAGSLPFDDSQRLTSLISGIKELLCANEVRDLIFQDQPPSSMVLDKGKYYSHLETAGRILGKGICLSREGAKLQAAEDALKCLKMSVDRQPQKRAHSPRLSQVGPAKRSREEVAG